MSQEAGKSAFSAVETKAEAQTPFELLDNTDYNNLYRLAENLGVSGDALTFFDVHRHGDHFGETFQLLQKTWDKNPNIVKKGFDFIGTHQLKMWQGISDRVFT